jgi:hypothetical protein
MSVCTCPSLCLMPSAAWNDRAPQSPPLQSEHPPPLAFHAISRPKLTRPRSLLKSSKRQDTTTRDHLHRDRRARVQFRELYVPFRCALITFTRCNLRGAHPDTTKSFRQVLPMAANTAKGGDPPKVTRNQWFRKVLLDITSSEWDVLALSTAFKLLLFPT